MVAGKGWGLGVGWWDLLGSAWPTCPPKASEAWLSHLPSLPQASGTFMRLEALRLPPCPPPMSSPMEPGYRGDQLLL